MENDIKTTIRDTLPYFLGAATPEQSAVRRQLVATRRTLQRTQNSIRAAEADLDQQDSRVTHLIESAVSLNVLPDDAGISAREGLRALLESILAYRSDSVSAEELEDSRRRRELTEEGRTIRTRIREVDDQLELLGKLQDEQTDSQAEGQYQADRLRALDLLVPKSALTGGDVGVCPLCDQGLDHPDETVDELRSLLNALETRLEASKGISSRRQATIERLAASREPLVEALREKRR
ncbi:hypothetical protein FV141_11260 [Dermacoccus abyssi]|uniref:Zinc ribbon domain protein n=1 Tax=Dermacoccus abyssi TaxID=322596 RepID=A0ABX5ZDS4_9MICO|nr:hypothetical protein FV141_11260 [Dermacoccus abyssi]